MKQGDKTAIVTGASRGIGLAIALDLAHLGYALGIVSRSRDEIEAASCTIKEAVPGVHVVAGAFDIAHGDPVRSFVSQVQSQCGKVSVLVNNAGECTPGTSEITFSDAQRMMEVNYLSAVRFVQAVTPEMKASQAGYVFNIASVCGVVGIAEVGAYCASKFALVGYSEALGRELEPFGIRVTALCPSWVNTRMASRSPLAPDDMIQPQDIAQAVRFVLSLSRGVRVRQIVLDCE
jgi:3-oxoacyl-[acyl-carrier protein] reductase